MSKNMNFWLILQPQIDPFSNLVNMQKHGFCMGEVHFFNNRDSKLEPWKTRFGERSWDPILTPKMPSKSIFVDSKMVSEKR